MPRPKRRNASVWITANLKELIPQFQNRIAIMVGVSGGSIDVSFKATNCGGRGSVVVRAWLPGLSRRPAGQ